MLSDAEYKRIMETMPVVCIDCLVQNEAGEFLLVKRKNEPLKGEYWVPGGRLLKNERLKDGVHRKMREELGIEVSIIESLGYYEEFFEKTAQNADGGFHAVSFLFLVRPLEGTIKLDCQSSDWGWFRDIPTKLKEHTSLRLGTIL